MRHHNNVRKFGRDKNQRKALLEGLALSLVKKEKIMTTTAKAKELRPFIEKVVTQAKSTTVHSIRMLEAKFSNNRSAVKKLTTEIATRYTNRAGGYTRITKLPPRKSDGAEMAIIEFV